MYKLVFMQILIVIYVCLLHTLAVKVNWKFSCFILLLVAWKSIRIDPTLTRCHAFNLSVDFNALFVYMPMSAITPGMYIDTNHKEKINAMYVRYAVTEQDTVCYHSLFHSFFFYLFLATLY